MNFGAKLVEQVVVICKLYNHLQLFLEWRIQEIFDSVSPAHSTLRQPIDDTTFACVIRAITRLVLVCFPACRVLLQGRACTCSPRDSSSLVRLHSYGTRIGGWMLCHTQVSLSVAHQLILHSRNLIEKRLLPSERLRMLKWNVQLNIKIFIQLTTAI